MKIKTENPLAYPEPYKDGAVGLPLLIIEQCHSWSKTSTSFQDTFQFPKIDQLPKIDSKTDLPAMPAKPNYPELI